VYPQACVSDFGATSTPQYFSTSSLCTTHQFVLENGETILPVHYRGCDNRACGRRPPFTQADHLHAISEAELQTTRIF